MWTTETRTSQCWALEPEQGEEVLMCINIIVKRSRGRVWGRKGAGCRHWGVTMIKSNLTRGWEPQHPWTEHQILSRWGHGSDHGRGLAWSIRSFILEEQWSLWWELELEWEEWTIYQLKTGPELCLSSINDWAPSMKGKHLVGRCHQGFLDLRD